MSSTPATEPFEAWQARQARAQLTIVGVAVAAAALVVAWLALGGADSSTPTTSGSGPRIVTVPQLENLARALGRPVYWAGPKKGFELELTEASGGRIFVRYLPVGVRPGDPRPDFLSVGTYARKHALADLELASRQPTMFSTGTPGGGLVVLDSRKPTNVYFADPGQPSQVEVFAPSGVTARSLVLSGRITPVR
jgi:hypothetical protein